MAATALDLTSPRPGAAGPVYGVYGCPDPSTLTLSGLRAAATVLRQIPLDALIALETASPDLCAAALAHIGEHDGLRLVGAVGFDDWWTTALAVLNPGFPLADARRLVTNKAALYAALAAHGVAVPDFNVGQLGEDFLTAALDRFGRPVLKPATGAGSRGVYRYRDDLSTNDNLTLYRQLLTLGHIDSSIDTLATAYLGGEQALEISADVIVCAGTAVRTVVHEKRTATSVHPYVDRVMVSPPIQPRIVEALPALSTTINATITTLGLANGALHIELRLHEGRWHVLDVGVRPGAGLVPHAVHALTGVDPRMVHLAASINRPINAASVTATQGAHAAACIACCYIADPEQDKVTLTRHADLAATLRKADEVFGWHLNISEVDDQLYRPDAGLSIGVNAPTPTEAMLRLRSIVEPYAYTTS